MPRLAVALFVLVLLVPLSATPVTGTAPVTLTVTVENQAGQAVAGADLTASWEDGSATATTASNGKAFLDVPADATIEIAVDHPNYIRNEPYVVEDAGEREVTVPVHRRGSITVTAADAAGTVGDARVIVRKDATIVTVGRTTDDGTYETDDIERGAYTVTVVKPGYYRNRTDVFVDGAEEQRLQIARGSVTLRVVVQDPHFSPSEPVAEATVAVEEVGQITTLPNGIASVGVPVNTNLDVEVTKEGYDPSTTQVNVGEEDLRETVNVSRTPALSLETVNQRVVVGERVVVRATDEYGDPVAGATVTLDGSTVGETDDSGQLAVPVGEEGDHSLIARTDDLESDPVTVTAIATGTETTAEPTTTDSDTTTRTTAPGFGLPAALASLGALALLVALGVSRRGRRRR